MGTLAEGMAPIIKQLEAKYGPRASWSRGDASAAPPSWTCPTCRDSQWVYEPWAWHEDADGSKVPTRFRQKRCPDCGHAALVEDLWTLSGVDPRERERCTFAGFKLKDNPTMRPALTAAQTWGTGDGPPFLVLISRTKGLGKTHLGIAALGAYIERGQQVMYCIVPRLLDVLRATQRPRSEDRDDEQPIDALFRVRGAVETYPVLMLDDVGANKPTDWASEQLNTIVNERSRRELRTLVTTNAGADAIDERSLSRLMDTRISRVVICEGNDHRRMAL